jgi:hypothetical protein
VTDVETWGQFSFSWPQWYTEETANPMSLSVLLLGLGRVQILLGVATQFGTSPLQCDNPLNLRRS